MRTFLCCLILLSALNVPMSAQTRESHLQKGMRLLKQGRFKETAREYKQAGITLYPITLVMWYTEWGNKMAIEGRKVEAITAYRHALAINGKPEPNAYYRGRAHYELANALRRQKKPIEAVLHYRQAGHLGYNVGWTNLLLGETLLTLRRRQEARAAYHQALALGDADERQSARSALERMKH